MTQRPEIPVARGITVRIDEIVVPETSRPYNATAVADLSRSIAAIGLQSAPTLVERAGQYRLVAGRHRLEALKLLGHETVFARVVDFDDIQAQLWTISENLHRAELTVAQRAEKIAEYAQLVKEKREIVSAQLAQFEIEQEKLAQVAPVLGGRGNEGGDRFAARELGISRDEVRRAQKIADLAPEAKEAAQDFGLDDNQSALLAAAHAKTADRQVAVLTDIAARGRVSRAQQPGSLRNLENISGGELARWIKLTTPNDRRHIIRVLEMCAAILTEELRAEEAA